MSGLVTMVTITCLSLKRQEWGVVPETNKVIVFQILFPLKIMFGNLEKTII